MQPASLLASAFLLLPVLPAQTIDELVATLAKAESLDDEATGIAGTRSATYQAYERLRTHATREQLTKLLGHDAAIVRGYAFRALADRGEEADWPALLAARAADTAKVIVFTGCEARTPCRSSSSCTPTGSPRTPAGSRSPSRGTVSFDVQLTGGSVEIRGAEVLIVVPARAFAGPEAAKTFRDTANGLRAGARTVGAGGR